MRKPLLLVHKRNTLICSSLRFSVKSDVYSLGVIFWELISRCIQGTYERPYGEYKHLVFDFQIIIQTAKKGLRPTIPQSCPSGWAGLIRNCWEASADRRPECAEVLGILENLRKEYEAAPASWDSLRMMPAVPVEDSLLLVLALTGASAPPPTGSASSPPAQPSLVAAVASTEQADAVSVKKKKGKGKKKKSTNG